MSRASAKAVIAIPGAEMIPRPRTAATEPPVAMMLLSAPSMATALEYAIFK